MSINNIGSNDKDINNIACKWFAAKIYVLIEHSIFWKKWIQLQCEEKYRYKHACTAANYMEKKDISTTCLWVAFKSTK